MFSKKKVQKVDKKQLDELFKKYQQNLTDETKLIDINALEKDNKNKLIYNQFVKLENNELLYKLNHEKLEQAEKDVILTILDERQKTK